MDDPIKSDNLLTGTMRVSRAVREPDGTLVPGALAVLADSCLGMALLESVEQPTAMVTSHLHIEFMRQVPPETTDLSCTAAARYVDGSFGLTDGSIDDGAGNPLARTTLGGVFVALPESAPVVRTAGTQQGTAPGYSDIDALLGTDVVHLSPTDAVVEFQLGEQLSNAFRNVHGGMGALMGARAIDLVVHRSASAPIRELRLADIRAVFPKPIPANGGRARCIVSVPHRGRRLTVARAEVHAPDGRLAIMVDTTYVATTQ